MYQNDGGCKDRPFAREAVGGVAEDNDAHNFTDEDEGSDVALGIAVRVLWLVELLEDGVYRSDNLEICQTDEIHKMLSVYSTPLR